jgi:hypothetical protein
MRPVTSASSSPTTDTVAPSRWAEPSAAAGHNAAGAWSKALLFSLLAWAALLGVVFGSTAGVLTHTMAGKVSAHVLYLQRQSGPASTTRAARRDHAQLASQGRLASGLHAAVGGDGGHGGHGDGPDTAWPHQGHALRLDAALPEPLFVAAAVPAPRLRYSEPPSRAPPALT